MGREKDRKKGGWGSKQTSYSLPSHPHLVVAEVVIVADDDLRSPAEQSVS